MRALTLVLAVVAGVVLTGCPPPYVLTDLDGNWAAADGTVLEVRGPRVRVLAVDPFSYPENDPPCTGYAYVWCVAALTLNPDAEPRQLDITYPALVDGTTFVYCETDPQIVGFNVTLTAGHLTSQQLEQLESDYAESMLDTMQLSGLSVTGIYQIIDATHRQIALAQPGALRPDTFDNARLFTRDSRKYAPLSLGTFCG